MKATIVLGLILLGSISVVAIHLRGADVELKQAETHLEHSTGSKLKDTWPAFLDSLCKGQTGDELNRCRIYQTQLFEKQVLLYKST